jgi:hypothetical protein
MKNDFEIQYNLIYQDGRESGTLTVEMKGNNAGEAKKGIYNLINMEEVKEVKFVSIKQKKEETK